MLFRQQVQPVLAIMKATATQYLLVNDEIDERILTEKSNRIACKYFRDAKQKPALGQPPPHLYNMGMVVLCASKLAKAKQLTIIYCSTPKPADIYNRIIAIKLYTKTKKTMVLFKQRRFMPVLNYTTQQVSGGKLGEFAKQNNISYKLLRNYNPWIRDFNLINKDKKTFTVKLPS